MLVYLSVFSALAIFSVGNYQTKHTLFLVFLGLFLVWFMGFRYETGCDYEGYFNRWLYFLPPSNFAELFQYEEAGFAFLMALVKASGLDYTWLNVAASVILVFCYIHFARAHRFAPLILALLFPIIIIQLGMSGIRQAIAGGFLMLAFNAFSRKEKFWTAIWILVGMQFHVSVVMFLPIALLAGRQVNTFRLFMALSMLGPISALLLADRFETYDSRYIDGEVTSSGAILRYLLILLPVPFFIQNRERLRSTFPEVYLLLKFSVLLILSLAPLVLLSSIALHRLNYYVMPLSVLLCVYVGAIAFRTPAQGHLLAVLGYGLYSLVWFSSSRHAAVCYLPYNNTWFF